MNETKEYYTGLDFTFSAYRGKRFISKNCNRWDNVGLTRNRPHKSKPKRK